MPRLRSTIIFQNMVVRFGPGKKPVGNYNNYFRFSYESLIALLIFGAFLLPAISNAKIRNIGINSQYKTIKQALSESSEGDTLIVNGGIYTEGEISIDKRVSLFGVNKPVIDGRSKEAVITIRASGTIVRGFTISNSGKSDIREIAGIRLEDVQACLIDSNYFYNNYFAVYLANSSYCRVMSNRIEGFAETETCLLYTSPSPRDRTRSRMPSSA